MSATCCQCDTRPTVTFPATMHHRPLAGTKLYCLVTEAHAKGCTGQRRVWDSNPQPVDRKSSIPTTRPPSHTWIAVTKKDDTGNCICSSMSFHVACFRQCIVMIYFPVLHITGQPLQILRFRCQFSLVYLPRAGSVVVRIDPLHFLAGCRIRRLNPGLVLFHILACFNCIVAYQCPFLCIVNFS